LDLTPNALFYRLGQELPKETLPFSFAHFGSSICCKDYDEYLETHSSGGMFNAVRKGEPPSPEEGLSKDCL